jgi:hypothetical protein
MFVVSIDRWVMELMRREMLEHPLAFCEVEWNG